MAEDNPDGTPLMVIERDQNIDFQGVRVSQKESYMTLDEDLMTTEVQ